MKRALAIALAFLGWAATAPVRAQPLLVDLEEHRVAITAGFTGTSVLVFGAIQGDGDVVVAVKGPAKDITVRRKERVALIWMNADSMTFVRAPTFYSVASTRPLAEIAAPEVLQRNGIGVDHLRLENRGDASAGEVAEFRAGLMRNKQRDGLYYKTPAEIRVMAGGLFRADLKFPSNVPIGAYTVEVYLFRGGEVASAQTTPLAISNEGVGANVHFLAHQYAVLYGIAAIFIALLAGWAASVAFRRV